MSLEAEIITTPELTGILNASGWDIVDAKENVATLKKGNYQMEIELFSFDNKPIYANYEDDEQDDPLKLIQINKFLDNNSIADIFDYSVLLKNFVELADVFYIEVEVVPFKKWISMEFLEDCIKKCEEQDFLFAIINKKVKFIRLYAIERNMYMPITENIIEDITEYGTYLSDNIDSDYKIPALKLEEVIYNMVDNDYTLVRFAKIIYWYISSVIKILEEGFFEFGLNEELYNKTKKLEEKIKKMLLLVEC